MDEATCRATRRAVNPSPCVFEKALLAGCADCALVTRRALAEREALACGSPVARTNCETLHALLRERAAFAVRISPSGGALPHSVAMRLSCGGLRGLAASVGGVPADVHGLVRAAQERYGSLVDLPWPTIVAAVSAWEGRRRSRNNGSR